MGLENVPRCQHIKVNGTQCGSPALRRRRHCYFHDGIQRQRRIIAADKTALHHFALPLLEDANSVQVALMQVIQMLGSGRMDPKTAGLMLYALQTASSNVKKTNFEACVSDVVIDRDTVAATCIHGPQWFEEDFDEVEEEELVEDEDDETDDDEEDQEDEDEEDENEDKDEQEDDAEADEADVSDSAHVAAEQAQSAEHAKHEKTLQASTENISAPKKKPQSVRKAREEKQVNLEEVRAGVKALAREYVREVLSKAAKPV